MFAFMWINYNHINFTRNERVYSLRISSRLFGIVVFCLYKEVHLYMPGLKLELKN